jgi:hypothetical protein
MSVLFWAGVFQRNVDVALKNPQNSPNPKLVM